MSVSPRGFAPLLLGLLLLGPLLVGACARPRTDDVVTDWLWHTEIELRESFGEPVDSYADAEFEVLVFAEKKKLSSNADRILSRTYDPQRTGRFYQGPITTTKVDGDEQYVVMHRFWISESGIIHRHETRIP